MALDGIVTRALAHELQQTLGARIHKIYQPTEQDIVLHIRTAGRNRKLLLSANPTYPRVHFTEESFTNPPEPPMFCMLMRKYCESGIIEQVQQIGSERILHFRIRQRDELGDEAIKTIVVELTGRHSNIILLDAATGAIVDGIHHVTPSISSYRIVMPGFAYTAPPEQHKADPLGTDSEQFLAWWAEAAAGHTAAALDEAGVSLGLSSKQAAKWLVSRFSGISPRLAEEMVYRAGAGAGRADADADGMLDGPVLWEYFSRMMEGVRGHRYEPTLVEDEAGKSYFSALPLTHIEGTRTTYPTMSACMEAFYGDKAERDMIKQRVGDLSRFLQQEHDKNAKKLEKLQATLEEAKDADRYRVMGELLFASLHMLRKGDASVELPNYYDEDGGMITVPLDPLLSPSDNAQRYFKKYNKAKNSIAVVQEQIHAAEEENRYFDMLLHQLAGANLQDAQEIREELVQEGYLRDRERKGKRKKKDGRPTIYCYTSSEGIPIYVGKNNLQNEYVTNRLAQPNDTWFHTKDIPGSHVVIRSDRFGDATLEEAAQLAAFFSQGKHSSLVPVDYTLIRHVRKPNGAKPGFVIYERQKTLFITPDADRVGQLPVTVKTNG
ncbi:NFACT family protein [Paenibacillus thiaminolyticus]|uniref:Rqc2 homolog RqcH n=1 Tax=Paenibacillus thiaminolyticus TaxID=49283 RepID=A0AAP9J3D7_PANTH|nr:NFACT RNA binding domain-containing protein [Paenibacillus thiaminolyticus]MCY9534465.1 NFACT family protein [Paenibacillus thiaminolyticus]MCY9601275.1 NFACT family protein [Paenibacillus thiaminolyticus]MCY9606496.1 NFACT family protein [Paenibacillus thiaminolyticus]MCY9614096.1 NFACT family protein [Paenibacillus thiaminolyticus]MCY9618633.1 NFACT family protein [Paenibacillus thiaminolyticus]